MAIQDLIDLYNRMYDPNLNAAVTASLCKRAATEIDAEGVNIVYANKIITQGIGAAEADKAVRYLLGNNPSLLIENITVLQIDTAINTLFPKLAAQYA